METFQKKRRSMDLQQPGTVPPNRHNKRAHHIRSLPLLDLRQRQIYWEMQNK
ncbi:hypothetical protein ES703_45158 [subsurface metagenome]